MVKKKKTSLHIVGQTTDGKDVIGGLWSMFETHGLPLDILFDICKEKGCIPGWLSLYEDMRKSGMEHSRILSKLEEGINDSFGKEYSNVVISRLKQIFEPQDKP